jgi:PAS domain S-box-containing protein
VSRVRILHLEDLPDDSELVSEILRAEGIDCELRRVETREEFLAALQGEIDVILSDFTLPSFDGVSALRLVRERRPEVPFIFVSGTLGEECAVDMLQQGASDYVLKQRLSRLAPAVRRALRDAEEQAARRRAEAALRESQEFIRRVTDASPNMLYVFDLEQQRLVYLAGAVKAVLGHTREELLAMGPGVLDRVLPNGESAARSEYMTRLKRAREGQVIEQVARLRHADGSWRWVRTRSTLFVGGPEGEPRQVLNIAEDVTERKQAEERIREQAALLDKAQDAIFAWDLDGSIRFWNRSAERLYGWTRGEVVGASVFRLLFGPEQSTLLEARRDVLEKGEWLGELERVFKGGRKITVESRWTLVRDEEGRPVTVLVIETDITEKKKLRDQFLRAQRMESIGTLAGGIAHDLNNVLSPILMALEVLRRKLPDVKDQRMLGTIEASAHRGADMVRQILAFARGVEGERTLIQPKHLVGEIERIARETFPRTIQIRSEVARDLWSVSGDATQLHQVLLNLCVNARDAMPEGGVLTLKAENTVLDAHYASMNADARPGPYVVIVVQDTGTGIAPAVMDRIFEPFFTTKAPETGTGLGLSTSLAIVKSHGGFVNVYSELGKGTLFRVYLPGVKAAAAAAGTEVARQLPLGHGETILVVDDEAAIREITRETLESHGYRVQVAGDGAEGIALFARSKDHIDAVITDMAMPVMDGLATIRALRRIDPSVRVIATSGLASNAPAVEAPAVHAFLNKPYTAEALLETLHDVLAGRQRSVGAGRRD